MRSTSLLQQGAAPAVSSSSSSGCRAACRLGVMFFESTGAFRSRLRTTATTNIGICLVFRHLPCLLSGPIYCRSHSGCLPPLAFAASRRVAIASLLACLSVPLFCKPLSCVGEKEGPPLTAKLKQLQPLTLLRTQVLLPSICPLDSTSDSK